MTFRRVSVKRVSNCWQPLEEAQPPSWTPSALQACLPLPDQQWQWTRVARFPLRMALPELPVHEDLLPGNDDIGPQGALAARNPEAQTLPGLSKCQRSPSKHT